MTPTEREITAVAQSLYDYFRTEMEQPDRPLEDAPTMMQRTCRDQARTAIEALREFDISEAGHRQEQTMP